MECKGSRVHLGVPTNKNKQTEDLCGQRCGQLSKAHSQVTECRGRFDRVGRWHSARNCSLRILEQCPGLNMVLLIAKDSVRQIHVAGLPPSDVVPPKIRCVQHFLKLS